MSHFLICRPSFATLLLALLTMVSACEKDFESIQLVSSTMRSGEVVFASFHGRVTDARDAPLAGAQVTVGDEQAVTDGNGYWAIDSVEVLADHALIEASADEYLAASRVVLVEAGGDYEVDFKLLAPNRQQCNGGTGGLVTLECGATITFQPNSVEYVDGRAFGAGDFYVETVCLDPRDSSIYLQMPGGPTGAGVEDETQLLTTYGAVGIALTDVEGAALRLVNGLQATLTLPIYAEFAEQAPSVIPTWTLDEDGATWREAGEAIAGAGRYSTEIEAPGWWNFAVGEDYVETSGRLYVDGLEGVGVPNAPIVVSDGGVGRWYTVSDGRGRFRMLVPADEVLGLSIADACSASEIRVATLGPYQGDATLSPIYLDPTAHGILVVNASVRCATDALDDAEVGLVSADESVLVSGTADADGRFTLVARHCRAEEVQLVVYSAELGIRTTYTSTLVQAVSTEGLDICGGNRPYFRALVEGLVDLDLNAAQRILGTDFSFYGVSGGRPPEDGIPRPALGFSPRPGIVDGGGTETLGGEGSAVLSVARGDTTAYYDLGGLTLTIERGDSLGVEYFHGRIGPGQVFVPEVGESREVFIEYLHH